MSTPLEIDRPGGRIDGRFQTKSIATLNATIATMATAVPGSWTSVVRMKATSTTSVLAVASTSTQVRAPVSPRTRR